MIGFDQRAFNSFVVDHKVIGFFDAPIKLKSGRTSNWYVNWRIVAEDVYLIDQLTEFVVAFTDGLISAGKLPAEPECFYGVPEGATKLGILTQYKWAKRSSNFASGSHVLAMGRAKPKEHGMPRDRFFVGAPRGRVVVLEDVTTTGGSLLETIDNLIASDIEIVAALGLTNRMERRDDGHSVAEAVAQRTSAGRSVPYFQLSNAIDLLPLACTKYKPNSRIVTEIEQEFERFGVEKLKLRYHAC